MGMQKDGVHFTSIAAKFHKNHLISFEIASGKLKVDTHKIVSVYFFIIQIPG